MPHENRDTRPENAIHPTAVIDPTAKLGRGNYIGPFSYVGPGVVIGDGNRIEGHVSIGAPAEHRDYFHKAPGPILIGSRNVIREFVTVNGPTTRVTKMGDDCTMLRGSHLSHDSVLEDRVTVSCNVLIGGETYVMRGANLGLGAIIHQHHFIGSYAMLGMGTIVPKSVEISPGNIYVGNPARLLKVNEVGLQRSGMGKPELEAEMERYRRLREAWRPR